LLFLRYTLNELPKLDVNVGKKRRQPGPPTHQMKMFKISQPNENLYGKLNVQDVLKKLVNLGVPDAAIMEESNRCILNLVSLESTLLCLNPLKEKIFHL
jgi:hypothetical protein